MIYMLKKMGRREKVRGKGGCSTGCFSAVAYYRNKVHS